MLDVFRRHGLIVFMLSLAVVSLFRAAADIAAGRFTNTAAVALLMIAIVAEEIERRRLAVSTTLLHAVRWGGFLGALGVLLRDI
jgi:uncharacterized YccA/Bax inhibitor family protein